ncbi:MAG: hypothetical protein M3342_12530 [Bacteroidota bacterium]|nr:hypothetical protein [Flavisolibacter sp.]MBD0296260.1 hypothetical protein [Flavisolibacter sp.]MBD0366597.1 hypothetical protein [Flavisolibacter sp.]MDQ3844823.1 hypothetical protein [Bacteroidota bacterium]
MKMIHNAVARLAVFFLSVLLSVAVAAQEKATEIDVNINKGGGGGWYTQPWVWVVGAALFILLLVALLRGNSSRE